MNLIKWVFFLIGFVVVMISTPNFVTHMLKNIICWKEIIVGPITAITVVFYSYYLSPKYNLTWVVITFLIGAVLAYAIPDMHWYPECHELAYEITYMPLLVTYISGLIAVAYCFYLTKKT